MDHKERIKGVTLHQGRWRNPCEPYAGSFDQRVSRTGHARGDQLR